MHEYRSFLKRIIGKFIDFMIASQHWSGTYAKYIKHFDGYLFLNYPTAEELTQEMVDLWCRKHPKETSSVFILSGMFIQILLTESHRK